MTRINADIDPKTLHRRHLIAELREITMVPAALKRALRTKSKNEILESISEKFTLGSGHVRFFYDKQRFLMERFMKLTEEMRRRGYAPDHGRVMAFIGFDKEFNKNWAASSEDNQLVQARIDERKQQKPHLYEIC
jgi:deoxyribonuclease (pyrimidine dimer)